MKDRIREIRKNNKMNQAEFGAKLGVKGNTIGNYELGLRNPSDAVIFSICREFNINEEWLRTGKGDMYIIPIEEDALIISELIEKDSPVYDLVKSIIKIYKDLDAKSQEVLEKFCVDLADELTNPKK